MTDAEKRKVAKEFASYWRDKGYEKGQSQIFWVSLLRDIFGVEHPEQFISFEEQVHLDHTSFIDAYIPATKVMIEQKGLGKDLNKPIKQSDGTLLTPFQQAKRYITELPVSQHPRWVVTCNFEEFYVYDMERPGGEPERIHLKDLEKEYYRLSFLTDTCSDHLKREMEVSIAAGDIVGLLYEAFLKQYKDPEKKETLKSLNILCVRLVFCLYAEDAGIFGRKGMFHDYLEGFDAKHMRKAVIELFEVLDTENEKRDPYLDEELAQFPYVNGGLFREEHIEIPQFTEEIRDLILNKASAGFDWSEISPTIFGAVFESTLNPETRRSGGMHYTSIENIHRVIDSLFLDDLKKELKDIRNIKTVKTRDKKLKEFQNKLAGLKFLDPACGSGNFLTEIYLSLRRLENEIIRILSSGQQTIGLQGISPIKVEIGQFYGIEINDFAVTVAKTALWIAESQMLKETEDIVFMQLDFLPLTTNANIVEGNALRLDWRHIHAGGRNAPTIQAKKARIISYEEALKKGLLSEVKEEPLEFGLNYKFDEINLIVDEINLSEPETEPAPNHYDYIISNPPFLGYSFQSKSQKDDILSLYTDEEGKAYRAAGKIDYVAGWYFKAASLIHGTDTKAAFVSTNSVTQGEQVGSIWKPLYDRFGIHIDFAYRTFRWDSEANIKAHVHCVIIGFSAGNALGQKRLYTANRFVNAVNINPYLLDAPDIFISSRKIPIDDVPIMMTGNRPADGGNLIIEADLYDEFIKKEPKAKKYIKRLIGSEEFINGKKRYCLWLVGVSPKELRGMPEVMKRIEACRADRLKGAADRQKLAERPALFREINNPDRFIVVPKVSSEKRRYVPIGFMDGETISTDLNFIIPEATVYHFGVLTSNVHMAWMRAVAGRLEMRYRYSKEIVYNNFPWPSPTDEQKAAIEKTAQAILNARALYPDSSMADLYDELTMPPELRKAHQENDKAVMRAYGMPIKDTTESDCVAELMRLYSASLTTK